MRAFLHSFTCKFTQLPPPPPL
ncbi:hypothetical protein ISN44_As04g007080, partial [Arabidopsis suecica]